MRPHQLPLRAPQTSARHVPVWWLAAGVTTVLLTLGIGWSLIM